MEAVCRLGSRFGLFYVFVFLVLFCFALLYSALFLVLCFCPFRLMCTREPGSRRFREYRASSIERLEAYASLVDCSAVLFFVLVIFFVLVLFFVVFVVVGFTSQICTFFVWYALFVLSTPHCGRVRKERKGYTEETQHGKYPKLTLGRARFSDGFCFCARTCVRRVWSRRRKHVPVGSLLKLCYFIHIYV